MRINSLKALDLILSLSKDEAKISGLFINLLECVRKSAKRFSDKDVPKTKPNPSLLIPPKADKLELTLWRAPSIFRIPLGVMRHRLRVPQPGRRVGNPDVLDRPDARIIVERGNAQHDVSPIRVLGKNVRAAGRTEAPKLSRRQFVGDEIVLARYPLELLARNPG